MLSQKKKRALVIVGAGASVDYGIPTTADFGALIEAHMQVNDYCVKTGGFDAYLQVKSTLESYYLPCTGEAHFERIYHVLHELAAMRLTAGAVPKHKPILFPFLNQTLNLSLTALRVACQAMLNAIYQLTSQRSRLAACSLEPLSMFLQTLGESHTTRIYSTNYDDFVGQAAPGFFTGYTRELGNCRVFSPRDFWSMWDHPSLFHLHGSIHMGFPHMLQGAEIGELGWFDSCDDALKHANFTGSGIGKMDGTSIDRSAILTGLDKLGRIQQTPYSFYYAGLSRDLVEADLIFILGSGLGDLHLNTWIKAARRQSPQVPLIYVGYWPCDENFFSEVKFEPTDRNGSVVHDLRMKLHDLDPGAFCSPEGWTIDRQTNAAIWSRGFQSFLNSPETLADVLQIIGSNPTTLYKGSPVHREMNTVVGRNQTQHVSIQSPEERARDFEGDVLWSVCKGELDQEQANQATAVFRGIDRSDE